MDTFDKEEFESTNAFSPQVEDTRPMVFMRRRRTQCSTITARIPDSVKRAFRDKCIQVDATDSAVMRELMMAFIEDRISVKPKKPIFGEL